MRPTERETLYNISSPRAEWKRIVKRGEASVLIKGTNRRVIVVRSPDPKLFEEAIFVLREDGDGAGDARLVLEQASKAAGDFLKKCGVQTPRKRSGARTVLLAAAILLIAGLAAFGVWYFLKDPSGGFLLP